jgi:hypothetical protein
MAGRDLPREPSGGAKKAEMKRCAYVFGLVVSASFYLASGNAHAVEKSNPDPTSSKTAELGLPRIGIEKGKFVVRGTGKRFHPQGFQYIRIDKKGHHYVFRKGAYDKQAAEKMFKMLSSNGFNLVRYKKAARTEHAPAPAPAGDASRYLSQSMITVKCLYLSDFAQPSPCGLH